MARARTTRPRWQNAGAPGAPTQSRTCGQQADTHKEITMSYVTTTTTPIGPFTVIADDNDTVLASGWTDDRERLLSYIAADLRPDTVVARKGSSPVVDAVTAYHDGELSAPDGIAVRYSAGPFMTSAWGTMRKIAAGEVI